MTSSDPQWYQYSSRHNGGSTVNWAFCDGSVRGIKASISNTLYQYAAGKDDGGVFSHNDL